MKRCVQVMRRALFGGLALAWLLLALPGRAVEASPGVPAQPVAVLAAEGEAAKTIADLQAQLQQAEQKAEQEKLRTEMQALKEQVHIAVNNSQKAADWWVNAVGVLLAVIGLVVTVIGFFIPTYLTREQRRELNERADRLTELTKQAQEAAAQINKYALQAETDVDEIKRCLKLIKEVDPSKVAPGTPEALKVQNARAAVTDKDLESLPIEIQLRTRALEAQACNDWLTALSLWQQLLDKKPNDGQVLMALGKVFNTLAEQQARPEEQKRLYESAVQYFERAVECLSGASWAEAQNNLGNVLSALGERERDLEKLEQAVIAYHEALKEYTRERVPLSWAMTQNNLGIALSILGERENNLEKLKKAERAYREALKEFTREREPLDWAATQNNLGNALSTLGERDNDLEKLKEAERAYREALKERTRERVPLSWATTQNNLGTVLQRQGEREGSPEKLEHAVTAYREALKERARNRVPLKWAKTQANLGSALLSLGERKKDREKLKEAERACEAALEVFNEASWAHDVKKTGRNLQAIRDAINRLGDGSHSI